ncbi:MAG: gliding motility-associated C-terminal domain-containing protein, partial [Bacteroidia bacterium]
AGGVSGGSFPATVNGPAAQNGPNYGCLGTQPNPAWYFLQISQAGNLDILIAGSANQDVDFICWGPYSSLAGVCNSLTASYIVDCSYSSSPTETLNIVGAAVGQYYMVLITNFSNMPQNINFTQIAGTGSTNCSIVPTNTAICGGGVATITITNNTNLANPSYSVQPGPIFPSSNIFTVSPSVTTSYTLYVTGTNTLNSTVVTQSAISTVTVHPAPVISPTVMNSTCANQTNSVNLNISFIPNTSPNYTVIWSPPPSTYVAVNSATAFGLQAGMQNVTVTTGSCSTVSSFSVGPVQAPASFSVFNASNNYTVSCNTPVVVLTTSITNNVPLSFLWQPSCTGTMIATSMNFSQACVGQVVGTSSTGCSMTRTFQVFEDYTSPTVAITPSVLNVSCTPGAGCFTLTSNLGPNVSSQWYQIAGTNSVPVGPAQGTINIFCPTSPGIYSGCSKNNLTGCVSCKTVQVNASVGVPSFTVTSPSNFTLGCSTKSITSMQVSTVETTPVPNVPVNYAFVVPPGTATPVFNNNPNQNNIVTPGTWVVFVKDLTNDCITSQSVSIIQNTVVPNVNYIVPLSILSCKEPSMVLQGISSNPNTTITWTVPASPSPSVNPTPSFTVKTNPAVNGATNNITVIGIYTVGAVDNNNLCLATKTLQVNQDLRVPRFTISALTNSAITCNNADVVIVPIVTPSLAVALVPTYEWFPPIGSMVPGTQFNSTSPGSHSAIATSVVNGCTANATYIVATDINPPVITAGIIFTLDCNPSPTVSIEPVITPSVGPYTYSWTAPPGVLISNPIGRNLLANQVGLYKIAVTNTSNGCQSSESYSVVNGELKADFTASPQDGFAPLSVIFNNTSSTSTGASSINCLWSFGNGIATPSTVLNTDPISMTYTSSGTYTVVLLAQKGTCVDSASLVITVDLPSKMVIPNVFTPNEDKVNDIFRIQASNLLEIEASIFDRWGNLVYEVFSETGNIAWDGKNLSGKPCAEGTYFYIIKAKGKDGEEFNEKGNVSLFR